MFKSGGKIREYCSQASGADVGVGWQTLAPTSGTLCGWLRRILGPNPAQTLLANPLPRGDQRRKGGDGGFCGLGMAEPGHDAFQIDADRDQNVLEMGFRQTNRA